MAQIRTADDGWVDEIVDESHRAAEINLASPDEIVTLAMGP